MVHHDQFTLRADHEALMFNPVSLSQQLLNIGLSCIAPVQVNQVPDESLLQIFLIMLQLTLSRLDRNGTTIQDYNLSWPVMNVENMAGWIGQNQVMNEASLAVESELIDEASLLALWEVE